MKLIGVFGGTFDPFHNAHLNIALQLKQQLSLDEIRLIPCFQPPHRPQPIASPAARLEMVKLGIAKHAGLIADDCELRRGGNSYTVDTLDFLQQTYPKAHLCLILGQDAFINLDKWHNWDRIAGLAHVIVVNRAGSHAQANQHILQQFVVDNDKQALRQHAAGCLQRCELPPMEISATQIRGQLALNKPEQVLAANLLPEDVLNYIVEQHLYQP